jgi:hypothetical protein
MRARLAEEELRSAWNAWFERRGPMPTDELVAEVLRRRQADNESLDRAIRAHKDANSASQRR